MAKKFIPSSECADQQTLAQLRYLKRAAELLEARLKKEGSLPSWVKSRIARASIEVSVAASYDKHLREKERKA